MLDQLCFAISAIILVNRVGIVMSDLSVDCRYDSRQTRMSCSCSSISSSTSWNDLASLINDYVSGGINNLKFNHVSLRNCQAAMLTVDFTALSLLSSTSINYVSFENIDSLSLYLQNVDSGDKTIVTDDINNLVLSGRMYEPSSRLRFFIRNGNIGRTASEVAFDDFVATTRILLINIQDVDTVTVRNSAFDVIDEADFIDVATCRTDTGTVTCSKEALFVSTVSTGISLKNGILIAGLCLLIVAIIVAIAVAIFIARNRNKDLELLGYSPHEPPVSRPNVTNEIGIGPAVRYPDSIRKY